MPQVAFRRDRKPIFEPIAHAAPAVIGRQRIPRHTRIPKDDMTIVIRAEQPDGDSGGPNLAAFAVRQLVNLHILQPSIMRASMISGVRIPLGRDELGKLLLG